MDNIILYHDKDIKYEIVNYESEYIIYAKLVDNLPKILGLEKSSSFLIQDNKVVLGFINFKFISENECMVNEIITYPNFKNILNLEIEDFDIFDISKVLLKKAEYIAYSNGIKYIIIINNYKNIRKPLSLIYFYIFLTIILGLKILNFLF
jgi:hypothetical protein